MEILVIKEKIKDFFKYNWFKIVAILFLLGALGDNPYSYYQFLRWIILVIAAYSTYLYYNHQKITWVWIFGIIAILFNPVIPFHFSKDSWQFIDVVAAAIFFISLFNRHEKK